MSVEIRETMITHAQDVDVVQLHISDALPGDESAEIVLRLTVPIPKNETIRVMHAQRDAMKIAQDHLSNLLRELATKLQNRGIAVQSEGAD